MKTANRVILTVLDSLGIGALPDAHRFGDEGADTFGHIAKVMKAERASLRIKNLCKLGFCNIKGVFLPGVTTPAGAYGRLAEKSQSKDTTAGHWEIAGLVTDVPFKTYPEGFPREFTEKFGRKIGRKILVNRPYSGTEVIEDYGDEHESTGNPIVYTSADSVFQIAANTDVIPLDELYDICLTAREMLTGEWACARVIARPYVKKDGKRIRTSERKDFSLSPPGETVLGKVRKAGGRVHGVGKIEDIFNGKGIDTSVHTKSDMDGVDRTIEALNEDFSGIIFTNLVDFDAKFGHRRDPLGYGRALEAFDRRLPEIQKAMKPTDVMMITADHGNDPTFKGTDHTREYAPFLAFGESVVSGADIKTRESFADIGATVSEILGCEPPPAGKSFAGLIMKNELR